MNGFDVRLAAMWLERLGRERVAELADGLECGKTVAERSLAIAQRLDSNGLSEILLDGFQHHFHQTGYVRYPSGSHHANIQRIMDLRDSTARADVGVQSVVRDDTGRARALLFVARDLEFLPPDDLTFTVRVSFPVAVQATPNRLFVQVLTVQVNADSWERVLDRKVRRRITSISADRIHDEVLDFLRAEPGVDVGEYRDFSQAAVRMIGDAGVDTYSGGFEVGVEGVTRYDTVGASDRRSLRTAMPKEFGRLIAADRISRVEVHFTDQIAGMRPGSQVVLHPTIGTISVRALLKGGDLFELIDALE